LLLRDWRITVPALLLNYICLAIFLAQKQFVAADLTLGGFGINTIVATKLITGIAVTAILIITALTFSKEYGLEDLDEFGLAELRRAARAAQRRASSSTARPGEGLQSVLDYVIPLLSIVLALLVSLILPRLYPISPLREVDFAWYWLGLVGLFTLATAGDILKIGLGLLLCISSIDLLYTAVISDPQAGGVAIGVLLLLSLVTILLALMVAYLSGLLYGRLKTLELDELYKQQR
jgi:hypothetical protein